MVARTELRLCSEIARRSSEALAGTASHARECVLLSYPKRLWARNALASEGLPERLLEELDRLGEERDAVCRLIAHEGPWDERVEVLFFPQAKRFRDVPLEDVANLLAAARRDELPEGEAVVEALIACCTHGQRDRCCALFGLALANELRRVALATGSRVEVREASHLGGDRFAPTVLVLPSGHMYGHLELHDAESLLAAASGAPPLRERFRGSLWLDPLEQLAEVAAFGLPGLDGAVPVLGPIAVEALGKHRAILRCAASWREREISLVVECALVERRVVGDCRAAETGALGGASQWTIEHVRVEPPGA